MPKKEILELSQQTKKELLDTYRHDWELFKVLLAINFLLLKLLFVGAQLIAFH